MAPKRQGRRGGRRVTPVDQYAFYLTADLRAGFVAVGPSGGISDDSVPHFLKLQCVACGKSTERDVCLYNLAPGTASCTLAYGSPAVMEACFPKCANDAHLIRKCKPCGCGRLGSVELTPPAAADMAKDRPPLMVVHCIGYVPVEYTPGPGWIASTTNGSTVDVYYTEGGKFVKGRDKDAFEDDDINVGVVGFEFRKA